MCLSKRSKYCILFIKSSFMPVETTIFFYVLLHARKKIEKERSEQDLTNSHFVIRAGSKVYVERYLDEIIMNL